MRSGTIPTALAVGLGKASEIAANVMVEESKLMQQYFDYFMEQMMQIPEVYLNGDRFARYPGNINLSFSCIEGESMIGAIKNVAVSSGSACTSASLEPSYVLRALGVDEELAHTSIRFGIGRFTTKEELDFAIDSIKKAIDRLREMSPLWSMVQQGIDLKTIQWAGH
jgi:cysteine desulfurase